MGLTPIAGYCPPCDVLAAFKDCFRRPNVQRYMLLSAVYVALLLDNMLYMVIIPIIPLYLEQWQSEALSNNMSDVGSNFSNVSYGNATELILPGVESTDNQDIAIGILFTSKAFVQLLVNPISGTIIDRIGFSIPLLFGLAVIFASTVTFAFGSSYAALFVARSIQGVGSAFADTSALAIIADIYTDQKERTKAQGIALAFISFGALIAPPFGGFMYEIAGKMSPFLVLAGIALIDGLLFCAVMGPVRVERARKKADGSLLKATPIYTLIADPYIAVCAGCLIVANISLAFLEPTIATWMSSSMNATEWQIGFVWLPAFVPHILGVVLTIKLTKVYPQHQWLMAAFGLVLEGISCIMMPFCTNPFVVIVPLMLECFGIALVDTAIIPLLSALVDSRHTSVYGSVYAIADISYSLAYALGPMISGILVSAIGFTFLNLIVCLISVLYSPLLYALRKFCHYEHIKDTDGDDDDDDQLHKAITNIAECKKYQSFTSNEEDINGYIKMEEMNALNS